MHPDEDNYSLETTCRTCLKNDNGENLYSIFKARQLMSLIEGLAFIKLEVKENDGLPQNICSDCIEQLLSANEFRASCEISQDILKKHFNPSSDTSATLNFEFVIGDPDNYATQENIQCNNTNEVNTLNDDHENDEDEMFICNLCNVVYYDEPLLIQHISEIHGGTEESDDFSENENIDDSSDVENEETTEVNSKDSTFFCTFNKCEKSDNTKFKGFETTKELEEHKMKRHHCSVCDKPFAYVYHHMLSHENERSFICDICSAPFKTMRSLRRHLEIHDPIMRFKCDYCDKRFRQSSHKNRHLLTHTGERPFTCNKCDKTFKDHHGLNLHTKINHLGKHPHTCEQCGKGFVTKRQLERHDESMHGVEAEERLRCDAESRKHQCTKCDKSFKRAEHLRGHFKRLHTQIRPFKCEYCGKRFLFAAELKPHMLVHTGEKPHLCPFCPRRFNLAKCMRDHVRRIHKQIIDTNTSRK